jgi:hypothetical protein
MDNVISDKLHKSVFLSRRKLFIFCSIYRNAFRSDGDEDQTVLLHTVPLRGGAMQRHAPADCL